MVLIPPLEGAVVQAALGGFAVLAAGFRVTERVRSSKGKPEKRREAKLRLFSHARFCHLTGNPQDSFHHVPSRFDKCDDWKGEL